MGGFPQTDCSDVVSIRRVQLLGRLSLQKFELSFVAVKSVKTAWKRGTDRANVCPRRTKLAVIGRGKLRNLGAVASEA